MVGNASLNAWVTHRLASSIPVCPTAMQEMDHIQGRYRTWIGFSLSSIQINANLSKKMALICNNLRWSYRCTDLAVGGSMQQQQQMLNGGNQSHPVSWESALLPRYLSCSYVVMQGHEHQMHGHPYASPEHLQRGKKGGINVRLCAYLSSI